jgi:hypothetical protein
MSEVEAGGRGTEEQDKRGKLERMMWTLETKFRWKLILDLKLQKMLKDF